MPPFFRIYIYMSQRTADTLKEKQGRQEALKAFQRFTLDHDLSTGPNVALLARKFLVLSANGVQLDVAYPFVGNDMRTVIHRVGAKQALYRSTSAKGYEYSPEMWAYLFSKTDPKPFRELRQGGAISTSIDEFRHFSREMSKQNATFRELPEWKKLLGFYMAARVYRDGHAVCRELLDVSHGELQDEFRKMRPVEQARAIGALAQEMSFDRLEEPEFRMLLNNPLAEQVVNQRAMAAPIRVAAAPVNPWDAPAEQAVDAHACLKDTPARLFDLNARAVYSRIPSISQISAKLGDFAPLEHSFQQATVGAITAGQENADMASDEWHAVIGLLDYADISSIMATPEMADFLDGVASAIGVKDFNQWTRRDAAKKLLTVHRDNWRNNWTWVRSEPVERAVEAHLSAYPQPSQELMAAIKNVKPNRRN